ncbi:MAG TPA: hypothetical protein DDW49_09265 [Deltaproteobacteria bacterium]|nr:MAG: hypothetical protein A2048_08655 [Deltaproteobacteria bacterium GWA2_45_12]HBF13550.1 hypothetical protein [Deltaproteobacteria bacterium]
MKRLFLATLSVFLITGCSNIKLSGDPDSGIKDLNKGPVILEVNGKKFHEGYLEYLARINPRAKAQIENPTARKQLLKNLAEQELFYQAALKEGADKRPEVTEKLAMVQKMIVSQSLLEARIDQEAKKYYDEKKDTEFTKVGLSQIQVNFIPPTENEKGKAADAQPTQAQKDAAMVKAKTVRERLTKGEDFAKVAEEVSDDKISKRKGGDMGEVSRNDRRMERHQLTALAEAAFKMTPGGISEIIETPKGYHIIKINSEPAAVPFDEAVGLIRFQVQGQIKDKLLTELTSKAKIVYPSNEEEKPGLVETPIPDNPEGAPPAQTGENTPPPPPPAPPVGH